MNIVPGAESHYTQSATDTLANLSPEEGKRLAVLRLEYDVLVSTGEPMPTTVTDDQWLKLLRDCPTVGSRMKYYSYLYKMLRDEMIDKVKSEKRRAIHEAKLKAKALETENCLNTVLQRVTSPTILMTFMNNLCYSLMNGPHLVFDMSFESEMKDQDLISLTKQLLYCHSYNKSEREPFHFHFCNVMPGSRTEATLRKHGEVFYNMPYTVTSEHYLDCYPASQLVYLSPNAPRTMTQYDPNDVYIIGGIVDTAVEEPLTFAKAKREKLRTARFPLHEHVRWVNGSKALTLNQVVDIMIRMKRTNDWKTTLTNCLPMRKVDLNV